MPKPQNYRSQLENYVLAKRKEKEDQLSNKLIHDSSFTSLSNTDSSTTKSNSSGYIMNENLYTKTSDTCRLSGFSPTTNFTNITSPQPFRSANSNFQNSRNVYSPNHVPNSKEEAPKAPEKPPKVKHTPSYRIANHPTLSTGPLTLRPQNMSSSATTGYVRRRDRNSLITGKPNPPSRNSNTRPSIKEKQQRRRSTHFTKDEAETYERERENISKDFNNNFKDQCLIKREKTLKSIESENTTSTQAQPAHATHNKVTQAMHRLQAQVTREMSPIHVKSKSYNVTSSSSNFHLKDIPQPKDVKKKPEKLPKPHKIRVTSSSSSSSYYSSDENDPEVPNFIAPKLKDETIAQTTQIATNNNRDMTHMKNEILDHDQNQDYMYLQRKVKPLKSPINLLDETISVTDSPNNTNTNTSKSSSVNFNTERDVNCNLHNVHIDYESNFKTPKMPKRPVLPSKNIIVTPQAVKVISKKAPSSPKFKLVNKGSAPPNPSLLRERNGERLHNNYSSFDFRGASRSYANHQAPPSDVQVEAPVVVAPITEPKEHKVIPTDKKKNHKHSQSKTGDNKWEVPEKIQPQSIRKSKSESKLLQKLLRPSTLLLGKNEDETTEKLIEKPSKRPGRSKSKIRKSLSKNSLFKRDKSLDSIFNTSKQKQSTPVKVPVHVNGPNINTFIPCTSHNIDNTVTIANISQNYTTPLCAKPLRPSILDRHQTAFSVNRQNHPSSSNGTENSLNLFGSPVLNSSSSDRVGQREILDVNFKVFLS